MLRFERASDESGQAFLAIVAFMGIFLLGVVGLATDYNQIWAYRQVLQAATDAACEAGAADLLLQYQSPTPPSGISYAWFSSGSSFACSASPTSPPCSYALMNLPAGFSSSNVSVSFPSSLPGVSAIPGNFGSVAHPYIEVAITYPVPLSFTRLVSPNSTFTIGASAGCGLSPANIPIPLMVLHPSASGALSVGGAASIKILGGPTRSIQVNSSSHTAASVGSGVNLSLAGPSGTGADFAVFGGPATNPGVVLGSTGHWVFPAIPIGDPWVTVPTPGVPATAGAATPVPFAVNGCPDPKGCAEFSGGNYTACTNSVAPGGNGCPISPSFTSAGAAWVASHAYAAGALLLPTSAQHNSGGYVYQATIGGTSGAAGPNPWNQVIGGNQVDGTVTWQNMGPNSTSPSTAIFDPGLSYLGTSGLSPGPNTTMRMSTAAGDGSSGATFYFSTAAGTVSIGNNVGKASACTSASPGSGSPNKCVVSYRPDGAAQFGVLSRVLQCTGGPPNPSQVPVVINGNILFGPCSGTYGSADGKNRGFLFFQNRSTAASPSWGGGGQFLLSGYLYFHQTSSYGTTLGINGGSGAGAYTLGSIVADQISMSGNSSINMILNPQVTYLVLRPTLLQ